MIALRDDQDETKPCRLSRMVKRVAYAYRLRIGIYVRSNTTLRSHFSLKLISTNAATVTGCPAIAPGLNFQRLIASMAF